MITIILAIAAAVLGTALAFWHFRQKSAELEPPAAAPREGTARPSVPAEFIIASDPAVARVERLLFEAALEQIGPAVLKDSLACMRIHEAAELAAAELATASSAEVSLPYLLSTLKGPMHLQTTVHRG